MDPSNITLDTPIKFLRENGSATHSTQRSYAKNRWLAAVKGPLVLCKNGYHITTPRHWREWADAQLWLVETKGDALVDTDQTKSCHRSIKLFRQLHTWNPRSQRLLACQIAESVLHLTSSLGARTAIEVARQYAWGRVTEQEMLAASGAAWAASGAAWASSRASSRAASRAAWASSEAASGAAWASSEAAWAASEAARLQHAEWFLATIKGEINQ